MNPADLLSELELGEYLYAFEENAIDAEALPELTDGDLKDLGIEKLGHRKKILKAIKGLGSAEEAGPESDAAESTPDSALESMRQSWPAPVAIPLKEYLHESHPVARLWAACDTVEMLLRLLVITLVADRNREGLLDDKLRAKLAEVIES
ncbi:MAG: SAM domain-containing protein, partial [SAR324 cluster bacterium]|nr:SAM domain-containing protein [SAR324 cluster bacterium]